MRLLLGTHLLIWAAGSEANLPRGARRLVGETGDHAAATTTLPRIHRDPFDRLLLAQAVVEEMTLLTSNATLASYPGPIRKI